MSGLSNSRKHRAWIGWPEDQPPSADVLLAFLRDRALPTMQGLYDSPGADLTVHEWLRDTIAEGNRLVTCGQRKW